MVFLQNINDSIWTINTSQYHQEDSGPTIDGLGVTDLVPPSYELIHDLDTEAGGARGHQCPARLCPAPRWRMRIVMANDKPEF